jgi:hypothetical protein
MHKLTPARQEALDKIKAGGVHIEPPKTDHERYKFVITGLHLPPSQAPYHFLEREGYIKVIGNRIFVL